ncbi:Adenylate cyclase family protein [Desulfamplus magnetovallimortis]|uniref:Adenylate cyclase family protein n=1 Tax=Desulfamplus magnetovallimortis TaxID=1246637 RepID=A0A1W1HH91_9BACT|nr:adenylate/guanylate cyclase domain-containing protein [Desulfamplus magnetovallimortis]SLM31785.1 Adenylate cyclase family protein [Desulfamplus magnetovallimortis]
MKDAKNSRIYSFMVKEKKPEDQFDLFRKNFLSLQKKYDEKIKEISIIKEMNNTMQQIDFIDQDLIWTRHLECLKKYKSLAAAALYFSSENEIKRDHFFYTDFEEPFDINMLKNVSFFQELLCTKKVIVIEQLGKAEKELMNKEQSDGFRYCSGNNDLEDLSSDETEPHSTKDYLFADSDYSFYGQSISSGSKVVAVLMLFARDKNAFESSNLYFYNVVCEHLYNSMVFLRLYYGKLNEEKQMIQLSRFFSKNIIGEIFKKGKLRLGGEKKRVAVLFVDLKGFTSFSESMEPEDVVILLNRFFSRMIPVIFRNRGTLDKLLGDGIMAVFGTPIEDDESCLHAVRTALEMFSVLNSLNREQKNNFKNLEMTVGINYGELIAGFMGSEEHLNYTVVGDTVNVAQRIQSLADSNQIYVSGTVWEQIKPHIENLENLKKVVPLEDVKLKGKEKKVSLVRLDPDLC